MIEYQVHAPILSKYYVGNSTSTYKDLFEKMSTFLQWIKTVMVNYGNKREAVIVLQTSSSNFHYAVALFLDNTGTDRTLTRHYHRLEIPPHTKTQLRTQCRILQCPPGWHLDFNQRLDSPFNNSYGWTCQRCKGNTIKPVYGNSHCIQCHSYYIANDLKTKCLDPYVMKHFDLGTIKVKLYFIASCLCCFLTIMILGVLIWCRNSCIVNAMDFKISLIHLCTLLLLFIVPNIVFFMDFSSGHCIGFTLVHSICNVLSLSVLLVKSQKLLTAFNSKIIVSKCQIARTMYQQIGIVLLNMVISVALFAMSLKFLPVLIKSKHWPLRLTITKYCDSNLHMSIQLTFQICLQIACFVPGYKGRNLPSVFNEAMVIVYVSFSMVCTSLVVFPIQFFQKDPNDKYLVEMVASHCISLVQLVLIYGTKVYIMLFQPHKNTKEYFRRQTMEMNMNHARTVSMTSSSS